MRRTQIAYFVSITVFLLTGAGILSSAKAAKTRLLTRAEAKAFFDEYFEYCDNGKVPRRGASAVWAVEKEALDYIYDALKNRKSRLLAIRILGHADTKENVLSHLYPFLKDTDEGVRGATAVALGRRLKPEATQRLIPLLKDPVDSIVRVTVDAIGNCGGKGAARALLDLYRNGETHDNWGYNVKNEILMSLRHLQAREALGLGVKELNHKNLKVFQSAVHLVALVPKDKQDKNMAGKELLAYARKNRNPKKINALVWGLGQLKCATAIPYIRSVYREQRAAKYPPHNYVVAVALARIATPDCAPILMEIYLSTFPLAEMTCPNGEPIVPCLRGLRTISGKDFGDDRKKWKGWYDVFAQKQKLGNRATQPNTPTDADKPRH